MMSSVEVNDILYIKIRYPDGEIADKKHYYLVTEEIEGAKYIMLEISQFDSLNDKNKDLQFEDFISLVKGETNTCISKDSYIDKRKEIRIEKYDDLLKYKVKNPLSEKSIKNIINDCKKYRQENLIMSDNKVDIMKNELENLNS